MMHEIRGAQAFVSVAESKSFTAAARSLGVTPSAVSQAVSALETRIGVPLFVRNTRSVRLTEVGQRLVERLRPALHAATSAIEEARGALDVAQGTLRITAGRITAPLVIEPVLPRLLQMHPKLSVEVSIDDRFVDILEAGFDAGIRLNEAIAADFTIVRLTPPFRLLVAGAPGYIKSRGRPRRPADLVNHDCINYRMGSTGTFYAWEFARRGRAQQVAVKGRFACNDGPTMVHAAIAGLGLVYMQEQVLQPHVARGELEVVLEDYAALEAGFFLYFPRRAGLQPKLRAFIEVARQVLRPRAA
jgi:DNA-binding transcriptional LysR family regulator